MEEASVFGDKRLNPTEELVEQALSWMGSNTGALAQAIANRQHLEQWIKSVEAEQKAKWKAEPAHVQEREARASEQYRSALGAFQTASSEEQRLRYTWTFAETVIDVFRTKCANERRV
jgi:ribulose 1,5-bisphosphate carboxylase large subunit-like protein